jgi:prolyl 4-hydroxylase
MLSRFKKQDNFIHIVKNALRKEECALVREWFEDHKDLQHEGGVGVVGEDTDNKVIKEIKDSIDISLNSFDPNVITSIITDPLNNGFEEYQQKYPTLSNCGDWTICEGFNIQKYGPGGGYKDCHFESSSITNCNRILVWMFYLNDIKGGGTEFPYLHKKYDAKEGTLLIWPAGFTHTHKSQITNQTKYIITGWANFI